MLLEEQWGDWLMSQHQVGLAAELSCSTIWHVSGKQPSTSGCVASVMAVKVTC